MTQRDALSGPDGTQALPPLRGYPDALTVARAAPPKRTRPPAAPPAPQPVEDVDRPLPRRAANPQRKSAKQPKKKQPKKNPAAKIGCLVALAIPVLTILAIVLLG
ncbi:hypothetical protein [Saccharopolyspora sp. NPDC050642]|uniref:hypothetical protein n=1 Tax=Saccharopolyspora sp. NPDC050642 TaxID=3157099 RepID=UPI0033E0CBCF